MTQKIKTDRKILHIDMNNCYASIESLYDSRLREVPFAVAGSEENRHGIILAKNQLAKECGVVTGEAIWQAREKCPELLLIPPHFERYMDMSRRARLIYERYTDRIEPFGLDECWLDVTCTRRDIKEVADEIRETVKNELGITVSVGASFNKVFAKLGSDMKKPDATTVIDRENFRALTGDLSVGDLLYVGRSTMKKLNSHGIYTIGELANFPSQYLKAWFGKRGIDLHRFANGIGESYIPLCTVKREVKSVSNGATAGRDLYLPFEIHSLIAAMSESVAYRMRKSGLCSRGVSLTVKSSRFEIFQKQRRLHECIDDSLEISKIADELFRELYSVEKYGGVRAITVCCYELSNSDEAVQTDLFCDYKQKDKRKKINTAVDKIRSRYGYSSIYPAAAGIDKPEKGNAANAFQRS